MRASVEILTEGVLTQSKGRCLFARDKPLRKTGHELNQGSVCRCGMKRRWQASKKAGIA
jgi:hypothetical protein